MAVKVVKIEKNMLAKNETAALENRQVFLEKKVLAVNMLSSPGAGKTELLVRSARYLKAELSVAVSVGDLQTEADADRISAAGIPVVQINTATACHLDAAMVQKSFTHFDLDDIDLLFIENVGNLVCPASFDLGEHLKVVILSTAEGEEKPLKYPPIFRSADCVCINKTDLLPYVDFDIKVCRENLKRICPDAVVFEFSCRTGQGLDQWFKWLINSRRSVFGEG